MSYLIILCLSFYSFLAVAQESVLEVPHKDAVHIGIFVNTKNHLVETVKIEDSERYEFDFNKVGLGVFAEALMDAGNNRIGMGFSYDFKRQPEAITLVVTGGAAVATDDMPSFSIFSANFNVYQKIIENLEVFGGFHYSFLDVKDTETLDNYDIKDGLGAQIGIALSQNPLRYQFMYRYAPHETKNFGNKGNIDLSSLLLSAGFVF